MASERKLTRSVTPDRLKEMIPDKKWQGPTKETKSSRQRREMNAGKGVRTRSLSSENSMEDLSKDANEWLRNKIMEQKKTIATLENDSADWKKRHDAMQERLADQESKNIELEKRSKEYEAIIDAESKLMVNNEAEMKRFKSKILLLEEQLKKTNKEKEEQHGAVKKLEQTQQSMQEQIHEMTGKLGEKNAESDSFHTEILSCKQHNDELGSNLEKLYGIIEKQTKEINQLKSELENADRRCSAVEEEKGKAEETCKKYESELTERIKESLSMMDDLDQVKMHGSQQNMKINELLKVIELSKMELRNKQNENEDLMRSRERLEKTIANEVEAKRELEVQLKNHKENIKNLEELLSNTTQGLNEKTDVIQNFINENKDLREKLVEATNVFEGLSKEANETKKLRNAESTNHTNEMKQRDREMEELRHEIDDLHTKCDLLEKECEEERHACAESKKESEKNKQQISQLKENVLHSVKGMNEKTSVLNNLLGENNALKETLKRSLEECDSLKQQYIDLQTESERNIKDNEKQIRELQTALEDLAAENKEYQEDLSAVKQKLGEREKQAKQQDELSSKLQKEFEEHKKNKDLEYDIQLGQIKTLQAASDEKCRDVELKEAEIAELNKTVKTLTSKNSQIEDKLKEFTFQNENLSKRVENMEALELSIQKQQGESEELKMKLGDAADKHQLEIKNLKDENAKQTRKLQVELDQSMSKSKEEMNELLNNFSELENELCFCQEELNSKLNENQQLRGDVEEMSNQHLMKEQKLLEDLEALNEQNENILQHEIEKYRSENEDAIARMTQKNLEKLSNLEHEFQGKIECLKTLHEKEKAHEIQDLKQNFDQKIAVLTAVKDKAETNFKLNDETHTREVQNVQRQMKMKEAEIDSKARINEKLGKRIETQQKLIDYLMKSLDQERNKRGESSKSIMNALSNIQSQLDDKFSGPISPRADQRLSPLQTRQLNPYTNFLSTSELELRRTPSNRDINENFSPWSASSPDRKTFSKTAPCLTSGDSTTYLNAIGGDYLSQSMPESSMKDLGYHSPSHESSTLSFYFAEQIKAISNTFDKIEFLDSTNAPAEQFNIDVWKQKIHFRLKVLDEQMSDIESVAEPPCKTIGSENPVMKNVGHGVTFRPGNDEIRTLIDNVNRKYQELNKKYLPRPNSR